MIQPFHLQHIDHAEPPYHEATEFYDPTPTINGFAYLPALKQGHGGVCQLELNSSNLPNTYNLPNIFSKKN